MTVPFSLELANVFLNRRVLCEALNNRSKLGNARFREVDDGPGLKATTDPLHASGSVAGKGACRLRDLGDRANARGDVFRLRHTSDKDVKHALLIGCGPPCDLLDREVACGVGLSDSLTDKASQLIAQCGGGAHRGE